MARHQQLYLLVTVDVQNVFNTAPLAEIDAVVLNRRILLCLIAILRSYMRDSTRWEWHQATGDQRKGSEVFGFGPHPVEPLCL